jgi:hypothetical protein
VCHGSDGRWTLLLPRAPGACLFALTTDIGSKRILLPAQQTLPQAPSIHSYSFTDIDKGEQPFTIIPEDPFLRIQKFVRGFGSRIKFTVLEAFDGVLQNRKHKSFFRLQMAVANSVIEGKSKSGCFHDIQHIARCRIVNTHNFLSQIAGDARLPARAVAT